MVVGLVVAAWASVGAIPARATYGARTTADEPQYLLTAPRLAEDGDLDIADEIAERRYEPFHEVTLDPQTEVARRRPPSSAPTTRCCRCCSRRPMALGGVGGGQGHPRRARRASWPPSMVWVAVRRFDVSAGDRRGRGRRLRR